MKKTIALALCFLTALAVINLQDIASAADKTKFTKHFNASLFNIADKGLFSVEILMDDREYPQLGKDVVGLVIHDKQDEDVAGAEIRITSVMAEGQTGTDTPIVKDKGEGLYTVSGLNLKKEGKWELKIGVKKKKLEDSASFKFPEVLQTPFKKGKYSAD